jgi:hypothetical protein
MRRRASQRIVSLFAIFLITTCVAAAVWTGTVAGNQTNQHLDATVQNAASDPHILLLQSSKPSNSTQASSPMRADNVTRIIVPILKVENTSSGSAQPFSGFELPTWFWIPVILVLLVILAYLFLKLLREGDNEPPLDKRPRAPASPPEVSGQQARQIPINESESEVERKNSSSVTAESRVRSIPIDNSEERQEPDDNSP